MGNYKAKIYKEKKLVYVELFDDFSVDQAYEATSDFWTKMASVGKNGYIICDLRKLKTGSRGAKALLQKIMKLVDSYAPLAVVRILSGYSGAMHFDRAYKSVGATYKVYRVETVSEAFDIVDSVRDIPCVFNQPPSPN